MFYYKQSILFILFSNPYLASVIEIASFGRNCKRKGTSDLVFGG